MVTKTKNFYVGNVGSQNNLRNLGISNINDAGYDATDRTRLFMHYDSKAGQIQLNPNTDLYGRANLTGGNYTFDPKGDYLNQGMFGDVSTQPIGVGSSGLDQPNSPVTGFGGSTYGPDNLRIAMPSVSQGFGDSTNGPSCPEGFYFYNGTCVPGAMFNPNDPNNVIGINTGTGSYQNARGVITRVITPVSTQKGALFQIVTQIQNIGHQAGKFYTKVSAPQIGLSEVQSNSAFLQGGQSGVLYATLQMPATVPDNTTLITVQSDLYQSSIGNPGATPIRDDSNTAQMPAPGVQYGLKPPTPPIPQFPVGGNTGSFGYPYNSQGPPPPPSGPGPMYPPPPPPPYRGFSARRAYQGYDPYQQQYIYTSQQSPYGASTPPPYPIYPNNYQPQLQTQPQYYPYPYSYPYYSRQPIQTYPYGYGPQFLGPPVQQPQQYNDGYTSYDFPTDNNSISNDIGDSGSLGGSINTNGINMNIPGMGDINTGTNGGLNNIPSMSGIPNAQDIQNQVYSQLKAQGINVPPPNMTSSNDINALPSSITLPSSSVPHNKARKHKHRHHNNSNNRSNLATISPDTKMHKGGSTITVKISGFRPKEHVSVQLYSTVNLMGTDRLKQLIGKLSTNADTAGNISATVTIPLTLIGKTGAIIATGSTSNKRTVDKINVV